MFQRRAINDHDEEESIFISMTDLTVSMMLLLVILLGFFASQFRDANLIEQAEQRSEEVRALQLVAAQTGRDMRDLTQFVTALETALLTSQAESSALQEDLLAAARASAEQAELFSAQLGAKQAENTALQSRVAVLEQRVTQTEAERDRAQSALAQATAEFEESLALVLSSEAAIKAMLQRSEALLAAERARALALEDDLARAAAALSVQQAERAALSDLRLAHETLEKQAVGQAARVAALQAELQSLEALLGAVIDSTTSLLGNRTPRRSAAPASD